MYYIKCNEQRIGSTCVAAAGLKLGFGDPQGQESTRARSTRNCVHLDPDQGLEGLQGSVYSVTRDHDATYCSRKKKKKL